METASHSPAQRACQPPAQNCAKTTGSMHRLSCAPIDHATALAAL